MCGYDIITYKKYPLAVISTAKIKKIIPEVDLWVFYPIIRKKPNKVYFIIMAQIAHLPENAKQRQRY